MKMPATLQIIYALMLLIICTVYETESANQRQHRKKVKGHHHEPASLASQQHHIIDKAVSPINLCSKERDMKLVCHCTPDDDTVKANKAECWIFRSLRIAHVHGLARWSRRGRIADSWACQQVVRCRSSMPPSRF